MENDKEPPLPANENSVTSAVLNPAGSRAADEARLLFRYLGGEEWREYRAILSVFADTFFQSFHRRM